MNFTPDNITAKNARIPFRGSDILDLISPVLGSLILLAVCLSLAKYIVGRDGEPHVDKWGAFKKEHACVLVSQTEGRANPTFSLSGKGTPAVGFIATPSQEGWKCDDGVTYYR